jgi:hypothetical protein
MMLLPLTTALLLLLPTWSAAFVPANARRTAFSSSSAPLFLSKAKGGSSVDLGTPCEDECAIEKFPNLPDSIHPGVLSGQAQIDLLTHAKENGEFRYVCMCSVCVFVCGVFRQEFFSFIGSRKRRGVEPLAGWAADDVTPIQWRTHCGLVHLWSVKEYQVLVHDGWMDLVEDLVSHPIAAFCFVWFCLASILSLWVLYPTYPLKFDMFVPVSHTHTHIISVSKKQTNRLRHSRH